MAPSRAVMFLRSLVSGCVLVLRLAVLAGVAGVWGAEPDEVRARDALARMLEDGLNENAERDAAGFAARYPESTNRPVVILMQAQARLALRRYDDALALLAAEAPKAGALVDEYAFWQAEARFRKGEFAAAAEAFARFATDFPGSERRVEAAVQEALARYQAGDPAQAGARLRDPEGPFQTGARAAPDHPWSQRGTLLLARLLLSLNDAVGAQQALEVLTGRTLAPALEWERQVLLGRAAFLATRFPEVLGHTTNLWTVLTNTLPPDLVAEAGVLEGRTFEQLNQREDALRSYGRNLATNLPPAQRRFALEKVIQLSSAPEHQPQLMARLQAFIEASPQDDLLDLARFALGDARFREYQRLGGAGVPATPENLAARTNLLAQARLQFEAVLANHPQSAWAQRAEYQRAWTLWEEGPARLSDALAAFRNATVRLTSPGDQARARFQWAECQSRAGDPAGALTNYWLVVTNQPAAAVTDELRAQALFSATRAAIDSGDLPAASLATVRLGTAPNAGDLPQRAEILLAEAYSAVHQPDRARAQYEGFLQRYTNSVWLPDVKLAMARTLEQRGDNSAALAAYTAWLGAHTNLSVSTGLVAQATFDVARVTHRISPDAASLGLLTNFVARFPADPNAPLAQYLAAEHLLNQGEFARAELAFQDRLLDPANARPGDELPFRARLMAGRAAVSRQGWQSAREHFDWLITNGPLSVVSSRVPVPVVAEAYIFRGDLFTLEPRAAGSDPLAGYAEALNAFAKVAERFPTNELAPRAWGRIGDCHFQLATADPRRYAAAAEAYQKVIESNAGPGLRSMAEVALGMVRERQAPLESGPAQAALFEAAMTHYLNVFYARNLAVGEGPDPPWLRQAGLKAAELAESLKRWDAAIGIYRRLITELPPLAPRFERKIADLQRLVATNAPATTPP